MMAFYHQTKTPISFWCRWGLNPRSLIQPLEILPVELTGTHRPPILLIQQNLSNNTIIGMTHMRT